MSPMWVARADNEMRRHLSAYLFLERGLDVYLRQDTETFRLESFAYGKDDLFEGRVQMSGEAAMDLPHVIVLHPQCQATSPFAERAESTECPRAVYPVWGRFILFDTRSRMW